jgi:predicted DsbA family dithiol-disulfide isomerase
LSGGKFSSLHGQGEVDENIRQLCAMKYYPKKYMDYIVCRNKNIRDTNWQSCATQAGLDANVIKSCFDGGEGATLHSASIQKSEAVGAQGSPTIYINNQPYQGGRDSTAFQRAICANLKSHPECASLPACGQDSDCRGEVGKVGRCQNPNTQEAKCVYSEDVKFEIIVLNDVKCGTACDTTQISQVLKQMFTGATQRSVDVSTDEGKKLVSDLGITVVPAYIFETKVTTSYTWETNTRIQGAFERKGNYYKLSDDATGASWFVSEEARKKYQDAIGLTPGDNRPQIDFFVMSYCPYGNQAEEAIAGAYDILGDKATYIPHYVVYENYGGGGPTYCLENGQYCSMHGIQELNQDIRELCVYNSLGIGKYFAFVKAMNAKCTAQNADSCWTAVAKDLGLDADAISACEKEQGISIVAKEKELNKVLRVSGSPTVFVEGQAFNGGRTASAFASALCAQFDSKPAECNNIPADTGAAAAPVGGGCG